MNILQAMRDPKVFGGQFRERESWTAWEAFLSVLFALPMEPNLRRTFRHCTKRTRRSSQGYREAWLVCGRGSGKSFVLALTAVYLASFKDWTKHLAPGERATIMVIATDRRQARVIMRYVKGLLHAVPMLNSTVQRETAEVVDLNNRISIEVHACSFRSTRGYGIAAALLDEMAFWPTEDAAEPDREIIAAIKPGLARVPNSMLLCASSPHAKRGALYEAFRKHFGKDGDKVLVWKAPTRVMNPTIPQSVIDAALIEDPDKNRAEYLAEFRQDLETFIAREAVLQCVDVGVHERAPQQGIRYVSFVDPSGGQVDAMTCAIAHLDGSTVIIDALREVRAPLDPESVAAEFVQLFKSYGIRKTNGDRFGAQWTVQAFEKKGIEYRHAEAPRSALYLDLLPRLNSKTIRLLDHARAINQIASLERTTRRGARDAVDHPHGQHDDIANAIAGVNFVLTNKRPAIPPDVADWSNLVPSRLRGRGQSREQREAERNVANGSRPCTIDFRKLEKGPSPEGLVKRGELWDFGGMRFGEVRR